MCGGGFWCVKPLASDGLSLRTYFHYSPSSGVCTELDPSSYSDCEPDSNCTFSSAKECYSVCGKEEKAVQTCADTKYGCCGDGVTIRQGQGGCPDEAAPSKSGGGGKEGGHWGLITSGVCGVLVLLGLVAVIGLSTYTYRRRQRHRNRWYIHEVLQMYDGGDSSDSGDASDSSWDDPEHKNLFDRL
jgi:hypothetical protein